VHYREIERHVAERIVIGTAGWAVPAADRSAFPPEGTVLQRYAERFACVEINSTFYRSHRPSTFERWAESVPAGFRFSLKVPKAITHERRLVDCDDLLEQFLNESAGLGEKRAALLVQLPPKLAFEADVAGAFWRNLRVRTAAVIVCEPRHPSWFAPDVDAMLREYRVSRVAADPAVVPEAAIPGGDPSIAYYRLHGSPRTYYSDYEAQALHRYAEMFSASEAPDVWCIFDNTASGAATANALALAQLLKR